MNIKDKNLLLSSRFLSCQGESITTGIPSYFMRLGLCNLTCGISRQEANNIIKNQSLENGEIFESEWMKEGKATWCCDSFSQWAWRNKEVPFDEVIKEWEDNNILEHICNGNIHIIWTGGEPTMKFHQKSIMNFFHHLWNRVLVDSGDDFKFTPYNELETNGTILMNDDFFNIITQINCSPKLSNSGIEPNKRIKPDIIKQILSHNNYHFKFVINSEDDIKEIFNDFINPFNIPITKVWCMPGMDQQSEFFDKTIWVWEMSKKYLFRAGTRVQLIYDKTLDV